MDETRAREIIAELQRALPLVEDWIDKYLEAHAAQAIPVNELGFARIPHYFSRERLETSNAVKVDHVQVPPLSEMGIPYFIDFEKAQFRGITYKDTFFVGREAHDCEATHFHEMVHIIQWDELKPRVFLMVYAVGLLTQGIRIARWREWHTSFNQNSRVALLLTIWSRKYETVQDSWQKHLLNNDIHKDGNSISDSLPPVMPGV